MVSGKEQEMEKAAAFRKVLDSLGDDEKKLFNC